ncbi:major facilitator superfamily domain-containing protein [Macrophomina phaseolina]|uniref:Major facilitator superfamily domain-containing protein n=1 Tax=Macrophomina phaseolina TaxID=35725 RepID=A0ABQ8G1G8_9PEZI|nr:major facilitator superfamily domain-containing protein [Macrophomina phaseolina]
MPATREDMVPGTVYLVDTAHELHSQHARGNTDIVLIPQPSKDPEGPLNWSPRRKALAVGMAYTYTLGVGISTAVQYSVLTPIAEDTRITVAQLNLGTGLMFLFLGWANLLWQPLALVYGRRGVYVVSSFLCIFPVVWSAYSTSKGEWYAHRIILGIFAAPIESLPEITVPDLYFAHERGTYMGIYAFLLFGSNFLAPFFAGWIDVAAGWKWVMYFGAIVQAVAFLVCYLFMEETMYFRKTIEGEEVTNKKSAEAEEKNIASEKGPVTQSQSPDFEAGRGIEAGQTTAEPLTWNSYRKKLSLFVKMEGRPSNKAMFTMMWRPLPLMYDFPSVSWAGFVYGTCLSWYNVLNATASQILSAAPYNFSSGLVSTAYLSPFVAAGLAAVWSGWSADKLAIFLARRNGGIREPEQRLWALLLSGLLCAAGLILWGVGAARGVHWFGLIFGLGLLAFSVVSGGSIALSYDVDCFKEISGESMISIMIIRNTMGFAVSYGIDPWIDDMGLQNCFITVALVALACTYTFLPVVWYGKQLRRFSAKKYWEYVETSVVAH